MADPVNTAVPELSLLSRAQGIIFAPSTTFRSVVAHPRAAGILFLACLVMGLATALPQLTERGRAMFLAMQIEQAERVSPEPLSPEQRANLETMSRVSGYLSLVSIFVMVPIMTAVTAAFFWALFNVGLGGNADYRQVLAVVAHSQIILALGTLLGAPVQHLQGVVHPAGPFHLGALAAALPADSSIAMLLGAITVFGIWQAICTGLGLALLYRRSATVMVLTLLVAYLVLTAVFSVALPSALSSATGSR